MSLQPPPRKVIHIFPRDNEWWFYETFMHIWKGHFTTKHDAEEAAYLLDGVVRIWQSYKGDMFYDIVLHDHMPAFIKAGFDKKNPLDEPTDNS